MKIWKSLLSALTVLPVLMFAACGDDESGESSNKDKEISTDSDFFESVDELPACTDSLLGDFAKVGEDIFACSNGSWQKMSAFANGVCNVQECDNSMDGKYAYVKNNRKIYQCVAGEWLDQESKGFTEKEFVACYIDAIVQDSAATVAELPACDESLENSIFKASGNLFACSSTKWMELLDEVVAESDLPTCEKDGSSVFVLSKMKNYICKAGAWYVDGRALSSKDSTAKDSIPVITDSTRVRGICMPSASTVAKNEEVSWRFINMGGTVGTYAWLFDGDSVVRKASPKMSYAVAGVKNAVLYVNDGMPSQSGEIVCSSLRVIPSPVTNCACSVSKRSTKLVSEEIPDTASWSVQGCEGGDEFFYKWSNVRGSGAEASVIAISSGSYTPKVEIRNVDGSSMSISCPTESFSGVVSGQCKVSKDIYGAWNFTLQSVKNLSSSTRLKLVGDSFEDESVSYSAYASNSWVVKDEIPESSSSEEEIESSSSEEVVLPESSSSEEEIESSSSEEVVIPESSSSEEEPESSSSEEVEIPESSSSEKEVESSSSEEVVLPESSSSEEEPESSSSEELAVTESSSSDESDFVPHDPPPVMPKPVAIMPDEESSKVFSYALLYDSDTLCVAATTSCGPYYVSSVAKGESAEWYSSSINGFVPKTYNWMFSDGQTSSLERPLVKFDKAGIVKAKLLLDKGLATEKLITCSSLNVEKETIEDCSCGAPTLLSRSDDLAVSGTVQYQWSISGCNSKGAEPLSYVWSEYGKANDLSAVGSITSRGTYAPVVYVTNADGRTIDVNCGSVRVENSADPVTILQDVYSVSLTEGKYELQNCRNPYRETANMRLNSITTGCESWVKTSYYGFDNFSSYECGGYLREVQLPALIVVPKGKTLRIEDCYQ